MSSVNRALPAVILVVLALAVPVVYLSVPTGGNLSSATASNVVPSIHLPTDLFRTSMPSCQSETGGAHPYVSPINVPAAGTGAVATTNQSLFMNNTGLNTTLVVPSASLSTNQYVAMGIGEPMNATTVAVAGVAETSVIILGTVATPVAYLPNGTAVYSTSGPFLTLGSTHTFAITHAHGDWWSMTYDGSAIKGSSAWENGTYNFGRPQASGFMCEQGYPLMPSFIVGLYGASGASPPTLPSTNVPWAIGVEPSGSSTTSYVPASANAMPQFNSSLGVVGIESHIQNSALRINQLTVGSSPGVSFPGAFVSLWGKYVGRVLNSVTLTPTHASMAYGGTQVFNASAFDQNGNVLPPSTKYSWQFSPASLGTLNKTTGRSVKFTAGSSTLSGSLWTNVSFNCTTMSVMASIIVSNAGAPTIDSFAVAPSPIVLGQSTNFTVVNATWSKPITYQYAGLPSPCTSANVTKLVCDPSTVGSFTVRVFLNDTLGRSSNATTVLTVDNALKLVSFTDSPQAITLTENVTFSSIASGGIPPVVYNYTGLPNGCSIGRHPSTFTCVPANVTGKFAVTVNANDSAGHSVSGTTNLTVNAKLVVTDFKASPGSVVEGGTTYLNVTTSGGTAPFSYAYGGLPQGCTSSDTSTLMCSPSTNGSFVVMVNVTDSDHFVANATTALAVTVPSLPEISNFAATVNPVRIHQPTILQTTASGGTGTLTYAYSGLPQGCQSNNTPDLSCTPTQSGSFSVVVQVTDQRSKSATDNLTLVVLPPAVSAPTINSFAASPSSIILGGSTTFTVNATGSSLSYAYVDLPPGCGSQNTSSLKCTPTSTGNYSALVYVNNSAGSASKTARVEVNPATVGLTISSFNVSPTTVSTGQTATFTVSASGGVAPLTFTYTGLPGGCATSDISSLQCKPSSPGNFDVRVYVNDSAQHSATSTTSLTVTATIVLTQVAITPSSASVTAGGTTSPFLAAPTCSATCPSGIVYSWTLTSSSMGALNSSTGNQVTFTAANTAGAVTLFVNATLGGKTVQSSPVTITISQGSGSTTSSSGTTMLVVVLVVVAVVVVVAVLLLMKKRKPHGSTPAGQEAPYVAPPQTPSSPPGPPA